MRRISQFIIPKVNNPAIRIANTAEATWTAKRMYFFWIENVDNGYSNYLGGQSLRSGKLISVDGKFQSIMSDFNISQYDEITTSHNGFLTMSVEYGILPVVFLLLKRQRLLSLLDPVLHAQLCPARLAIYSPKE